MQFLQQQTDSVQVHLIQFIDKCSFWGFIALGLSTYPLFKKINKMLKHTATIIIFSTVFIFTLFIGFMGIKTGSKSFGSSTIGIPAVIATSSTIVVGIQQNKTLFTVNPYCSSRIITTTGNPIMLSFDTNITPSATVGHFQATSTTVAYDSGLYGCSDVKAYGVNASTTITITETR